MNKDIFDCELCGDKDNGGGIGGWGVHMELWNEVMFRYGAEKSEYGSAKGMICIECFEKRLGRKLIHSDFADTYDNKSNSVVQKIIMESKC